jgi:tetraacyldisaccharide 4'-kinase
MTRAARPLLWPFVPVYRAGLALREVQLRLGIKPVRRLKWPVVSVGSLSAGGAGKTPLVIALANALGARGLGVDVLSRGYGREQSESPFLVDPGGTAEVFGDEPLEITREALAPVYVGAERYEAGVLAEGASYPDREQATPASGGRSPGNPAGRKAARERVGVHLLDDGFQHRQLARDVDIVLLSAHDLDDHLLPAGNLREPLRAARRADVIAIPADEPDIEEWVKSHGWSAQVWRVRRKMDVPRIDQAVIAFCGIARPEQFFEGLERAGLRLAARIAFADHHRYTPLDLERIAAEAEKSEAAALVTTEKDRVRLGLMAATIPASLPLQTARLRVEIEDENKAMDWLVGRIGTAG